jgi:hypothetical protein
VSIEEDGVYNFQIDKTTARLKKEKGRRIFKYPEGSFEVGKITGEYVNYYDGILSKKKLMTKTYNLNKGKYVVKARIKKEDEKSIEDITLGIYS